LEFSNGIPALQILLSSVGHTAAESLYLPDLQIDMPIRDSDFPYWRKSWNERLAQEQLHVPGKSIYFDRPINDIVRFISHQ
jgi:hypothetical protein